MIGVPHQTEAGELSILSSEVSKLASCEYNLPMMNYSHKTVLKDHDSRFQKRYLDLIVNSHLKGNFRTRA